MTSVVTYVSAAMSAMTRVPPAMSMMVSSKFITCNRKTNGACHKNINK